MTEPTLLLPQPEAANTLSPSGRGHRSTLRRGEGRYPPYPSYKDSGLPWLGQVPEHWESWEIAHAFQIIGSGTTPPSGEPEWYDNGEIPWVQTSELRENYLLETEKYVTWNALKNFSALKMFPAGSLAIAMYGATIGRLGILGIDSCTNQACCVLALPTKLDTKFTFYWLYGFRDVIVALSFGGGQPNISQTEVRNIRIPAPSIPEQRAIASFLDHQTAKIDTLIRKKQQLIDLLREQRTALISHAVTRGLDPHAPLKDSGVEWLGQVPQHWETLCLKRVGRVRYGLGQPPKEQFEGKPLVRATNINSGKITDEGMMFIDPQDVPESRDAELREGEIIVVRSGAYTGDSAIVPQIFEGAIAGYDMIFTLQKGYSGYFAWQILSSHVRELQFNFSKSQIGVIGWTG